MEKELLKKIDMDISLLDDQQVSIKKNLKKIYLVLEDLEALSSKIQDTALYSLISRDFLVIKDLYYRERDKLEKEEELIIKKMGRLLLKKARILGQI